MTEELLEDLDVTGDRMTLKIRTIHGLSVSESGAVSGLFITDVHRDNRVNLPKVFSRLEIPVGQEQIPRAEVVRKWSYLQRVID